MKIAADTKISKATIHRWITERKAEQEQPDPHVLTLKNFTTMERKIERLENIVKVLKTVNCTVKSPLKKRLYAAEPLVSSYSIPIICEALNIPKGTFYNHVYRNKRDNTWYAKRREALRLKIQEVYDDSHQIFGAAKIHAVLKNQGIKTSPETVRELMRDMGLITIRQSAKALYVEDQRKYKNHVEQNFDTKAPNEIWVSDVTYFKCNETQFYICVVIDLFSRKVISYKISLNNSTQLVKSTVRKAFESREPKTPLILHTDRGSNYRSKALADYLKSINITHSYSRAYVPYDNSVVETFFSSMKREELYRTKYRSELEFKTSVARYIQFYNDERPHQKLQYKTPTQKEEEFLENLKDSPDKTQD